MNNKIITLKSLTLILGSGGARGLCFIGALKALDENGIKIGKIIGCSMGAIIGAAYCSGVPITEIEDFALAQKLRSFISFSPFSSALFSNKGIEKIV